ncbi:hypothetical protein GCM10009623_18360 [Nocardioides aestuarii]|uniref:Uncharacterized protein n=1 Tax=Nocardioides aestuarii TaxID=252231 RepID=A0ABW4TND8_9ACTN
MTRFSSTALLWCAAAAVVVGIWLAFDNPDIDGTSKGDGYTCLAPWDTVLNDADNYPGGEPPSDADEIAALCREVSGQQFWEATTVVAAGLGLAGYGLVVRRREREQP